MRKFSLVIPVYKQEGTIRQEIQNILLTLSTYHKVFEIIVVIDGDVDKSRAEAKRVRDSRVKVVGYQTNHGKGYAIRYGFAHATGEIIGFMDAGGDLTPKSLNFMLEQFQWLDADIVIGSKRHPDSKVNYPFFRKCISFVYQMIVKILFGLNVRDTQVGMKVYRRKVLEDVLPRLLVKQFAFDIEILAVSHYLGYTKIFEAPVELDFSGVISTITIRKIFLISLNVLKDTFAVFYRLRILRYYDDASKRKWRYDPELNFRINIG